MTDIAHIATNRFVQYFSLHLTKFITNESNRFYYPIVQSDSFEDYKYGQLWSNLLSAMERKSSIANVASSMQSDGHVIYYLQIGDDKSEKCRQLLTDWANSLKSALEKGDSYAYLSQRMDCYGLDAVLLKEYGFKQIDSNDGFIRLQWVQ